MLDYQSSAISSGVQCSSLRRLGDIPRGHSGDAAGQDDAISEMKGTASTAKKFSPCADQRNMERGREKRLLVVEFFREHCGLTPFEI